MKRAALICALALAATPALSDTVLMTCHFETGCGAGTCSDTDLSIEVVRNDNFALHLRGPDASVRVQRLTSGPLAVFTGTGYEPNDTGEDGGFTSLVVHENGEAVILSAVALPLGDGTLESGQFLGTCTEVDQ